MKLVYDLRYAADHFVGIGTYAFCTFEKLVELPGVEPWVAVWDASLANSRFDLSALRRHPRVCWIEAAGSPLEWRGVRGLSHVLARERPHVYVSPFHLVPGRSPCPSVVTLHDVRPLRHAGELPLWKRLPYRWSLERTRRAFAVATPSAFAREEAIALLGLEPGRVHVVRPGTNAGLAALEPRRPDRAPEAPFALVVGDNRPHKNLDVLACAWRDAGRWLPLVGAGPVIARHPDLQALAHRQGASGVVGLGRVSEAELAWLYRHARVLCFPSRYEGFGSPIAEALRFDVPVVASDIPALRETAGDAARYVSPDDPGAWTAAVAELASEGAAREALQHAGRRRSAELSYDSTARTMLHLAQAAAGARA